MLMQLRGNTLSGAGENKTKENLVFAIGKQVWEGSGVKTNCQVSPPACFVTKSSQVEVMQMGYDKHRLCLIPCCPTHQLPRSATQRKNQPVNRNTKSSLDGLRPTIMVPNEGSMAAL